MVHIMGLFKIIAQKTARTEFARKAVEERADLTVLRERPSARVVTGIALMAFSYMIGWPAVALFGVLAIYFQEPLIVIIGGPAMYGTSHLVFLAGLYLAGAGHTYVFARWATRMFVERYLDACPGKAEEEKATLARYQ